VILESCVLEFVSHSPTHGSYTPSRVFPEMSMISCSLDAASDRILLFLVFFFFFFFFFFFYFGLRM
jgi:hypothetical protein